MRTTAFVCAIAALGLTSQLHAAESAGYKIVERIKVPDGGFDYATFDTATNRVYMPRGNFTTVIDVKTGAASRLASGVSDHIALPVPGTNLMVLTQRKGLIRIIDKATDMVLAEFAGEKNPNSAAYDPVTKLVFVLNKESGTASIVDPVAKKLVGTMSVSPNILEFPVADGQGRIFDNIETTAEIVVIDAASRKVTGTYKLNGCEEPTGLAYVPAAKLLIYDEKRKVAFIPCGRDGVLEVISLKDPAHIAVVQHVQTEVGSRTGTVDPGTGRTYVIASKPDTTAAVPPGGRVPRLAGSWEVLVIAP
ncbi:MAG: YncE family protein [Rhodospirillaceae bacterium]